MREGKTMTGREKYLSEREWLRMKYYAITASLKRELDNSTLSEQQKRKCCAVQNRLLLQLAYHDTSRVQIGVRLLQRDAGAHYLDFVIRLHGFKELDTDRDFLPKSHCMSYWIPKAALGSGFVPVTYKMKRLPRFKRQEIAPDEVSQYALACMKRLRTPEKLDLPDTPDRAAAIHENLVGIELGNYQVRYGKRSEGGRLYHRIIQMPRRGRRNLIYDEPLFEFDVRTCVPILLLTLIDDPDENRHYHQLLSQDIYTEILIETGMPIDRDGLKKEFAKVINAKKRNQPWLRGHPIFRYFRKHFPRFTDRVLVLRTDMARYFQGMEASIMVQDLGKWCREKHLFWIPRTRWFPFHTR
jgi:hypothetical protein